MTESRETGLPGSTDLMQRLRRWTRERPARTAVTYLADGETPSTSLTFAELAAAAAAQARVLAARDVAGRPLLVLASDAVVFAVAFFACTEAGAIAVPCAGVPRNSKLERIAAIVGNCRPVAALVDPADQASAEAMSKLAIACVPIDVRGRDTASTVSAAPETVALLQYTSGSTGSPKGVILTHGQLAANLHMIATAFRLREDSVYLSWLPLFHDMGLIGNVLAAVYSGTTCIVMPPNVFYQRPQRWLAAIGKFGATISGGPNFAYDLCLRRLGRMDLSKIDLSRWELAFCGAERVRATTMRRFGEAFAGVGFKASALYPCYGLAEASVFVSGVELGSGVRTQVGATQVETVSCGRPGVGQTVRIVAPATGAPEPDGRIGEVWVKGAHVGSGYWNRPAETAATFANALPGIDDGPFLRTGDLGWMSEGDLYIAGRLKDLIIYRGMNLHPEDVEATAAACHQDLGSAGAAFSIEADDQEQVVLLQEVARSGMSMTEPRRVANAISEAVAAGHGIRLYDVVLLRPGSLPLSTSGKVRRAACRDLYAAGLHGMASLRAEAAQGEAPDRA